MTTVTKTHYVCDNCQAESPALKGWLNISCLCWHHDDHASRTVIVEEGTLPGLARAIVISDKNFCCLQCLLNYIGTGLKEKGRGECEATLQTQTS